MNKFLNHKNFFKRILGRALAHKVLSVVIIFVVIFGGYYVYGKLKGSSVETRYVLAAAQKGTLVTSVSGSGQVSALNQVDIKPKVSGDVISVAAIAGQKIKAGGLILRIDSTNAAKAVRDAEVNLQSAQIALEKLKQPADDLSVTQADNALTQAQQSKQNAQDDLQKVYDDGFNTVANAFIDLPGVVTGLDTILNGNNVNGNQSNAYAYADMIRNYKSDIDQFRDSALASYQKARIAYDKNLQDYKNASRYSDRTVIDSLIGESYETTKLISEAIKNAKSLLDVVNDILTGGSYRNTKPPAILATQESNLQIYTGTANAHLGNLLNVKNSIKNDQDLIKNSDLTIKEKTESLTKLKAGADPLDIQSQELSVKQRQNVLLDAQQTLADYFIRAPFDGVVAKIDVKKGDSAGSGTAVATVITSKKIAQLSLNEVDVAKIKIGQKATLTFDAFSDLTIAGEVISVDTIGTVTQGVVNYNIDIAFDTQDDRVKPSMSVSAAIITDTKQDVLLVSNSAVKSQGNTHYVEVLNSATGSLATTTSNQGVVSATPPSQQSVEIGISNDSYTEILSGLQEGEEVVTRTITGTATAATTQSQSTKSGSSVRIPGLGGGGF